SCRNRHCPKCQAAASRQWLADREAELLPVPYFHIVYTLPSELRDIAYQNKRVVYDLLMKAAAETTLAIAADPKRLGARIDYPRRLPRVLSPEDVGRLLEAAPGPGLKYKAALSVAYGAGLRASEVVALKVSDIDSLRLLIRVEQGKGRRDRHAMLSPQLLDVLR